MSDKKKKTGSGGNRKGPSLTSGEKKKTTSSSAGKISPKSDKPASVKRTPAPRKVRIVRKKTNPIQKFKKRLGGLIPEFSWVWVFSTAFTLFILFLGVMIYFAATLPDISGLGNPRKAMGVQVLADDGTIIGTYGEIRGDYLPYEKIPQPLIKAVIATEDRAFFDHVGVDPLGIARAILVNLWEGRFVQGGSTITQQLAKNVFLTPERTFKRKFQEMMLAFWLETRFSKQEILSIYLNRVYLGAGNYGVDAAARHYFEKPAKDLSLPEAAVIAGLLKAPSRYAPTSSVELSARRAHQVLLNMADAGMISETSAQAAFRELKFPERIISGEALSARYFADWVVDEIPKYIGNIEEDLVVQTTLDTRMQELADSAVKTVMTDEVKEKEKASQASFVAMRPDGAVVAMVGGTDYRSSQYNRVTQALRQPGSAFKLFVYLAAMEAGYTPDDLIEDKPIQVGKWRPANYKNEYRGVVTIREALARSINTVAVQLGQTVGMYQVVNAAKRLGVKSKLSGMPSLTLGAAEVNLLEMTGAYAHLANLGHGVSPYAIKEIRRQRDGEVLYKQEPSYQVTVINPRIVAEMNSMLSAVIWSGTGRSASIGRSAAGKTGTTSDYKDAWFIGYTPDLVAGAWVGNDNNKPMKDVTGGKMPAAIWKSFMAEAHKNIAVAYLPVDYQQYQAEALPWSGEPLELEPAAGGEVQVGQSHREITVRKVPNRAAQDDDDGLLGKQFWDKLFDEKNVEYSYPNQR